MLRTLGPVSAKNSRIRSLLIVVTTTQVRSSIPPNYLPIYPPIVHLYTPLQSHFDDFCTYEGSCGIIAGYGRYGL